MDSQTEHPFDSLYILNPEANAEQLFDAINARLHKAEALAVIAATIDFETYTSETIGNYLWALSDVIREVKWLHKKI